MDEQQGVCEVRQTRFQRFMWQLGRKTWPITSKLAWWIYRLSHPFEVPYRGQYPRWVWSFMNGLACGAWTHVCGHGLKRSFHMSLIYWMPQRTRMLADSLTVKQ